MYRLPPSGKAVNHPLLPYQGCCGSVEVDSTFVTTKAGAAGFRPLEDKEPKI